MTLYVVATPIGNLGDLTPRAAATLAGVELIACEDTRRTGRLLHHLTLGGAARPPLLRLDAHTEARAIRRVVDVLDGGGDVAVVSDAGTPAVADPGERLVRAVLDAGHPVVSVPGPSAVIAALVVSGLDVQRFVFEGFLPRRGLARRRRLDQLAGDERTTVVFESPHRLAATLIDLVEACGPDRRVAVARELTKLHEEVFRGSLAAAAEWAGDGVRGEVVLVVGGATPPDGEVAAEDVTAALRTELASGASVRDAAATVAGALGVSRRDAYAEAVRLSR